MTDILDELLAEAGVVSPAPIAPALGGGGDELDRLLAEAEYPPDQAVSRPFTEVDWAGTQEAAAEDALRNGGVVPWLLAKSGLQNVTSGVKSGVESAASGVAGIGELIGLPGMTEERQRLQELMQDTLAQSGRESGNSVVGRIPRNVAKTVTEMGLLSPVGRLAAGAGRLAGLGTQAQAVIQAGTSLAPVVGTQAATQAEESGLSGGDKAGYVASQIGAEAIPTALMTFIGLPGLDALFRPNSGQLLRGAFRQQLATATKLGIQEIPEELVSGLAGRFVDRGFLPEQENVPIGSLIADFIKSAPETAATAFLAPGAGVAVGAGMNALLPEDPAPVPFARAQSAVPTPAAQTTAEGPPLDAVIADLLAQRAAFENAPTQTDLDPITDDPPVASPDAAPSLEQLAEMAGRMLGVTPDAEVQADESIDEPANQTRTPFINRQQLPGGQGLADLVQRILTPEQASTPTPAEGSPVVSVPEVEQGDRPTTEESSAPAPVQNAAPSSPSQVEQYHAFVADLTPEERVSVAADLQSVGESPSDPFSAMQGIRQSLEMAKALAERRAKKAVAERPNATNPVVSATTPVGSTQAEAPAPDRSSAIAARLASTPAKKRGAYNEAIHQATQDVAVRIKDGETGTVNLIRAATGWLRDVDISNKDGVPIAREIVERARAMVAKAAPAPVAPTQPTQTPASVPAPQPGAATEAPGTAIPESGAQPPAAVETPSLADVVGRQEPLQIPPPLERGKESGMVARSRDPAVRDQQSIDMKASPDSDHARLAKAMGEGIGEVQRVTPSAKPMFGTSDPDAVVRPAPYNKRVGHLPWVDEAIRSGATTKELHRVIDALEQGTELPNTKAARWVTENRSRIEREAQEQRDEMDRHYAANPIRERTYEELEGDAIRNEGEASSQGGSTRGPSAPSDVPFSLPGDGERRAIVDVAAANRRLGSSGRVTQDPDGLTFRGANGAEIGIRQAGRDEVQAVMKTEGLKEAPRGWFARDEAGRPTVVMVPGATGAFTIDHELMHAAKALGLITRAELAALVRLGRKHGMVAEVRGKGYSRAQLAEEVAAHVVEAIAGGKIAARPGFVGRLLEWLRNLGGVFGVDARTDEQIGRDVAAGKPWERDAKNAADGTRILSRGDVTIERLYQGTKAERRIAALADGRKVAAGGPYMNPELGDIQVSMTSIGKALSDSALAKSGNNHDHFEAVRALPDMIRRAVVVDRNQDRNQDPNIASIVRLSVPVRIGTADYTAKLTVKSLTHPDKDNFYTYEITGMEMPRDMREIGVDKSTDRNSRSPGIATSALPDDHTVRDSGDQGKRFSLLAQQQDTSVSPAERMDHSDGAPRRPSDLSERVATSLRRHFTSLDPAHDAEAIRILREFEAERDGAGGDAARVINDFVRGLKPEQAQTFARRIELMDVARQIEAGEFVGVDSQGRSPEQILEQINNDLAKLKKDSGPEVEAAVQRRRDFQKKHTTRMVEAGLLDESVLGDDRYYHRQVLAQMQSAFAGLFGQDVRNKTRGFQRERSGGTAADIPFYGENKSRDFNTAYHQAEYEYLSQSFQELAKVQSLARLKEQFDRLPEVKAEAKARNRLAMDEWWQREVGNAADGNWDSSYRATITQNMDAIAKRAADSNGHWGGQFAHVWESLAQARQEWNQRNAGLEREQQQPWRFDHPDWWPALSWLAARPDLRVTVTSAKGETSEASPQIHAAAIFQAISDREVFTKQTLTAEHLAGRGPKHQIWQDVAQELEGFVEWQPEQGLQLGQGYVLKDAAVRAALIKAGIDPDQFAEHAPEVLSVSSGDAKRGMVVYGRKPVWLIPEQLANQLDAIAQREQPAALRDFLETATRHWKRWILLNPARVVKYNINNLFGDLDVSLTDPKVLREVARDGFALSKELAAFVGNRAMDAGTRKLYEAMAHLGVIDSGVQVAELPDVDRVPGLAALFGKKPEGIKGHAESLVNRYFDSVQAFGRWREGLLRVASFKRFRDQITPQNRRYAASRRDELDQLYSEWAAALRTIERTQEMAGRRTDGSGLTDQENATTAKAQARADELRDSIAAKLAREFVGDYGNLSEGGQWLRRTLVPFWSFMEINLPRYVRLIKNSRYEGGGGRAQAIGASLAMGAGLGMRMGALTFGVFTFNAMMKALLGVSDEEDPNRDADASKMGVIVGRRKDGSVITVRVAGAMADALGWFDGDATVKHVRDVAQGMREGRGWAAAHDVAADVGMSPVNRLANSITPLIKEPVSQVSGRDWFPDVRKPRPIGNRVEHLAGSLGLRDVVRASTDKQPWWKVATGTVLSETDPRAQASGRLRERIEGWASRNGASLRQGGGDPTERSTALREARAAYARGEQPRAARWLGEYYDTGAAPKNLTQSKAMLHPLASLAKKDRKAFLASLDTRGKDDLRRALAQWEEFWSAKADNAGFQSAAVKVWRERAAKKTAKP